ncbi:MAG: MIP/aquaporin family protein [Nitrospinota bacterium]
MGEEGKAYLAEFVGTFGLCFIGAGAIITDAWFGGVGLIGIALAHGIVLSVMVSVFGHISGAHVNPAVTVGLLVGGKIAPGRAVGYIVSQLAGGVVAGLLLRVIYPAAVWSKVNLGTPGLAPQVSAGVGVLVEVILTLFLVLAVYGTAVDEKGPSIGGFGIGLVLAFDILMGGPLTGASMNPARTFGPAVASGYWSAHWVYWVGPILGGILAAVIYKICTSGDAE